MKAIEIERTKFLADLETCLTVTKRLGRNLFECEYITPSLHKKTIIISTY